VIEELAAADRALRAEEEGDLKAAATQWDTYAAAYANPTVSSTSPQQVCFAATQALARQDDRIPFATIAGRAN